jgi:hypothetical protein
MLRSIRRRAALVIACIALGVALSGQAIASVSQLLPRNSVGTPQLRNNVVTTPKLRNRAVTTAKLANRAVTLAKLAPNARVPGPQGPVGPQGPAGPAGPAGPPVNLADGSITAAKLATNSVTSSKLAVTLRSTTVAVANGTTALLERPCEAGERVLAGGATWDAGFTNAQAQATHLVHSRPNPDLSGWAARGYNGTGGSRTFFVYAVCLAAG